jgi:hypothetical protein
MSKKDIAIVTFVRKEPGIAEIVEEKTYEHGGGT